MIFLTCHKRSSTGSTLWLGVVLFQDDPVLCEVTDVWSLSYIVNYIDYVKRVYHFNCEWLSWKNLLETIQNTVILFWQIDLFPYLYGGVVPGDIVEAEIISEYEKDMRLSVELGSSLLLLWGDAMAEQQRHQQGEQHSSSQVILLQVVWFIRDFGWETG